MGKPADWSNRLFVPVTEKFEEAYPELEDAIIEWKEEGKGIGISLTPKEKEQKFNRKMNVRKEGTLIRCSNDFCYRGGFQLGLIIHDMIFKKEDVREGFMVCEGDEGSPKGRRIGQKCLNHINYKITLKYKR